MLCTVNIFTKYWKCKLCFCIFNKIHAPYFRHVLFACVKARMGNLYSLYILTARNKQHAATIKEKNLSSVAVAGRKKKPVQSFHSVSIK